MRVRFPPRTRASAFACVALGVMVLASCGDAEKDQNTLDPKGPQAKGSLDLLVPFFWIAVVIGVAIIAATVFLAMKFRYREGKNENPVQIHGHTGLEITWTILPALLLVVMGVFTVAEIWDQQGDVPAPDEALDITVIGRQWWWQYKYDEPGATFYTANEMHIPEGKEIHLSIDGSSDGKTINNANVAHSFWIPNLVGTKDNIPGRIHNLQFSADIGTAKPGQPHTFLGQCKEYCGLAHADMRLRVVVHTQKDYEAWVQEQLALPTPSADDAAVNELVGADGFGCTSCHIIDRNQDGPDGAGDSGIGPNLAHVGSRQTIAGGKIELNLESLTDWIWDAPNHKPMACNYPWNDRDGHAQACVGMPSFRRDGTDDGAADGMTREQAQQIATFLLEQHK